MKRYLLVLLSGLAVFASSPALAAVSFINTNTDIRAASASSLSGAQTCTNSGSNIVAVARVVWSDNAGVSGVTVSAITFGGTTMVSVAAAVTYNPTGSEWHNVQFFTLAAPPTGSQTLSITLTASQRDIYADIICFNGADQTNPARSGSYTSNTGSGVATIAVTVASNGNDYTVSALSWLAVAASTNQTQDNNDTAGAYNYASDRVTTPAASVTHTWTLNTGLKNAAVAGFSVCVSGGTCAATAKLFRQAGDLTGAGVGGPFFKDPSQ